MNWAHFSWLWITELIVLIILVVALVKTVIFNYRKVVILTEQMCTSVTRAQTFLQHVDHEFEIMNTCAKSVKSIFLNFSRVYREISEGEKTVDDAIRNATTDLPEELRSNLSDLFTLPTDGSLTSVGTEIHGQEMPKISSLVDLHFSTMRESCTDEEFDSRFCVEKPNVIDGRKKFLSQADLD